MFPQLDEAWLLDNGDAGYTMPMDFSASIDFLRRLFLVWFMASLLEKNLNIWSEELWIRRQGFRQSRRNRGTEVRGCPWVQKVN